jgi:hypothetical protein
VNIRLESSGQTGELQVELTSLTDSIASSTLRASLYVDSCQCRVPMLSAEKTIRVGKKEPIVSVRGDTDENAGMIVVYETYVDIQLSHESHTAVTLYSLDGRSLYKVESSGARLQVPLEPLHNGVYIISVRNEWRTINQLILKK